MNKSDLPKLIRFRDPPTGIDPAFAATPQAYRFISTLDLSLWQLAHSRPDRRIIVEPTLARLEDGAQYKSDILVFMPFAETLRPVYDDHLKAVASRLGKSIKRPYDFFIAQDVMTDIWTAILETNLVIADCTGRNPNVFYESGLAHVVGKPTILITQNRDDVPFDLRHRRYIEYELTPRGMKTFEERLEETVKHSLESNER